jgi:hypothetical protein
MPYKVSKLTPGAADMLLAAVNNSKPRTDEDFYSAMEARGAIRSVILERVPTRDEFGNRVLETRLRSDSVSFPESTFRFVERVFKETREAGQVYLGAAADDVVVAMESVRAAERVDDKV